MDAFLDDLHAALPEGGLLEVYAEASREFARRAESRCQLRLWDGCFHELHWESERAAVLEFVVEWLNRRRDGGEGIT